MRATAGACRSPYQADAAAEFNAHYRVDEASGFPVPGGGKFQVSVQGGDQAAWRGDGKELYYLAPDRKLMAVPVSTGAGFQYEAPRALFQTRAPAPFIGGLRNNFMAAAGGQKFLVYTLDESAGASQPIVTVLNWMSTFNK